MGVPGFFGWLMREHRNNDFIENDINDYKTEQVEILYLDANCLIHPKCQEVSKVFHKLVNENELWGKIFLYIKKYVKYLYEHVNPKKLEIVIDGVGPVAKIKQQRGRRFKSASDNLKLEQLHKKHNKPYNVNPIWDSTAITPATKFMKKLTKYLEECIDNKYFGKDAIVHLSSSNECGEGENKIYTHLRSYLSKKKSRLSKKYVIYGLDGDLIFLSLANGHNTNIYLLREKSEIESKNNYQQPKKNISKPEMPPLVYVNIKKVRNCILKLMKNNKDDDKDKKDYHSYNYINDFILICKLLGNDFLPHFPSVNVRQNSMRTLINAYYLTIKKYDKTITKIKDGRIKIRTELLIYYFKKLSKDEINEIKRINKSIVNQRNKKKCYSSNNFDVELFNWNNLIYKKEDNDPIDYYSSKWKNQY